MGQVMVASLSPNPRQRYDAEEGSTRRMGFETILQCGSVNGRRCFVSSCVRFARQFSVLSRYLDPQWSIIGIQSPRPNGPMQTAASTDEVCEAHLATLANNNRMALITCWDIPLAVHAGAGIAARLRAVANRVAFLTLLDTGHRGNSTGRKKANGLDPECWRRLTVARPSGSTAGSTSTGCLPPLKRPSLMLCAC